MSLADIAYYYVCGGIIVFFITFIYESNVKIDHIDWVSIVTTGVFWPVYAVKYGLKLLTVMLNRLIYDIIHW